MTIEERVADLEKRMNAVDERHRAETDTWKRLAVAGRALNEEREKLLGQAAIESGTPQ